MQQDITKCSMQDLKAIFHPLEQYQKYVFWIRNRDMSQQIYMTDTYQTIWERSPTILYELPLLWLDYLAKENKDLFMRQLQDRHVENYLNPKKNTVLYQIETPSGEIRYLRDQCFKCECIFGGQYIVGISKVISAELWYAQYNQQMLYQEENDAAIYRDFFELLNLHFSISKIQQVSKKIVPFSEFRQHITVSQEINFSQRELECLYHLCQGKTAKETARIMDISHRTVETYLENIRNNTTCYNKSEVISRYARYLM